MKKNLLTSLILILLLSTINFTSADLGPKPSADIHLTLNREVIPDTSFNAKILTCQEKESKLYNRNLIPQLNISEYDPTRNCYWKPTEYTWGGDCKNSNCYFNYFLPPKFRLAVYLPSQDKLYLSAEVKRKNFKSTFEANLLSDGTINIQETTSFLKSDSAKNVKKFLIALVLTLILELLVALIYISTTKIPKKILFSVLTGSIITLPFVWFVFPLLKIFWLAILLGEIFAFIFESYFIYLLNKEIISLKKSFILSFLINLTSFIVGGFIFLLLSILFYI